MDESHYFFVKHEDSLFHTKMMKKDHFIIYKKKILFERTAVSILLVVLARIQAGVELRRYLRLFGEASRADVIANVACQSL